MKAVMCALVVMGIGSPSFAGQLDVAAPWAGSLIVSARAEIDSRPNAGLALPADVNLIPESTSEPAKPSPAANQTVLPQNAPDHGPPLKAKARLSGYASYYDTGRITANGEHFLPMGLTAAHRSLPFGTKLRVTNKKTGKSVVVRVNDRGPFIRGRILDLTRGAARAIGLEPMGVGSVAIEVL